MSGSNLPGWVQDAVADSAIKQVGWIDANNHLHQHFTDPVTFNHRDCRPVYVVTYSDEAAR